MIFSVYLGGVICAAPMLGGWYRAQVVCTYEDTDECDIKYVDYGGYARVQACVLRQIRSDFTTLPFQAVECYMANITPLKGESCVRISVMEAEVLKYLCPRAQTTHPKAQRYSCQHATIHCVALMCTDYWTIYYNEDRNCTKIFPYLLS